MRGPSPTGTKPACRAASTSSTGESTFGADGDHDLLRRHPRAAASAASSGARPSHKSSLSASLGDANSAVASAVTLSTSGTSSRPDCRDASRAIFCQRGAPRQRPHARRRRAATSARRGHRDDARDAELGRLLHHEVELVALGQRLDDRDVRPIDPGHRPPLLDLAARARAARCARCAPSPRPTCRRRA